MANKELIEMIMKVANLAKSSADELSTYVDEVIKLIENEVSVSLNETEPLTEIRRIIDNLDHSNDRRISEDDWNIIRSCLMGRLPRRPKNTGSDRSQGFGVSVYKYGYCRICNHYITNEDSKAKFCRYCGQRVDWSDLDE